MGSFFTNVQVQIGGGAKAPALGEVAVIASVAGGSRITPRPELDLDALERALAPILPAWPVR